jgi:hypothetical protein
MICLLKRVHFWPTNVTVPTVNCVENANKAQHAQSPTTLRWFMSIMITAVAVLVFNVGFVLGALWATQPHRWRPQHRLPRSMAQLIEGKPATVAPLELLPDQPTIH